MKLADDPAPLYQVDAAIFFPGADAGAVELLKRSGRPHLDFRQRKYPGDRIYKDHFPELLTEPRTNYQPIDCNFYDNFEAAIVTRREIDLVYRDPFGKDIAIKTQLSDLKTHRTEEFVQLADGRWLRLDRIVSVDGVAAGASCRF
ncbi:MAG: hypothetical protein AAFN92_11745 [Bacteroidota bacterium]